MDEKKEINESMLFSFKPVLQRKHQPEHFDERGDDIGGFMKNGLAQQTDYALLYYKSCIKVGFEPNGEIMQAFKRKEKNNEEVLKMNIGREINNIQLKILCETMIDYPSPFAMKIIDAPIGTAGLQIISQLLLVINILKNLYENFASY